MSEPTDSSDVAKRSLDLGKMTAEGATALLGGEIGSKLIGIIGSIVLIRLLVSPSIYAPIAAATTLPGLVMLGDITGVNSALARTLALKKREGDYESIWSSYWVALSIKFLTGALLSSVAFLFAQPIASLLGKQSVEGYLLVASGLPIVWTVQLNIKSTLISLGNARAYSWLQIVNEALLSFAPIPVVLLGYGAIGALIAMVVANFAYLAIGVFVSATTVFANTKPEARRITFVDTARKLVNFGLPLGLSNSVGSFLGQVTNLVVLRFVSLYVYGLYSVAQSANNLLSSISDPLSSMNFPIYSRIKGHQESEILQTVYRQMVRYSTMILLPFGLFFVVFARPFLTLFFGSAYSSGGIYLTLLALSWLYIGLGGSSNLIASQGYSKYAGLIGILSSVLLAASAIATLPTLGILPYILVADLATMPGYVLLVRKSKSLLSVTPPYRYVAPLYAALSLSGLLSFGFLVLHLAPLIEVAGGALLVAISFIVFSALLRGIRPVDAVRLEELLSRQKITTRLTRPLFQLLGKVIRAVQRSQ